MKSVIKSVMVILLAFGVAACGSEEKEKDLADRMAMEHENDRPVSNASWAEPVQEVETKEVAYAKIQGNDVTGYLARPKDAEGDLPGIIVIHEWWGLNDNIRMMTRQLAGEGYVALAVDLYNGKVADTPDKAQQYMREASGNRDAAINNLKQAHSFLKTKWKQIGFPNEKQKVTNIGVIGWCFGGGWSLQTALAMPQQIDATVIYYGRLVIDKSELRKLQMPILGIFGSEDRGIPVSSVREFESALNDLGKQNSIHVYEGANHAFANPSGTRYKEDAAKDAWQKTIAFFNEHLKTEGESEE